MLSLLYLNGIKHDREREKASTHKDDLTHRDILHSANIAWWSATDSFLLLVSMYQNFHKDMFYFHNQLSLCCPELQASELAAAISLTSMRTSRAQIMQILIENSSRASRALGSSFLCWRWTCIWASQGPEHAGSKGPRDLERGKGRLKRGKGQGGDTSSLPVSFEEGTQYMERAPTWSLAWICK